MDDAFDTQSCFLVPSLILSTKGETTQTFDCRIHQVVPSNVFCLNEKPGVLGYELEKQQGLLRLTNDKLNGLGIETDPTTQNGTLDAFSR